MREPLVGMCRVATPVEEHPDLGLWVKREDLACPGGPNFSKTRGVFAHVARRPERVIGVLDTSHSQGGWAVARACQLLGKHCVLYYPVRRAEQFAPLKTQQAEPAKIGAHLVDLPAGRSAILYHRAKKHLAAEFPDSYMMPNALKLPEMVTETAAEFFRTAMPAGKHTTRTILVSASSGTIAAGLLYALSRTPEVCDALVIHLGYSRPAGAVLDYVHAMAGTDETALPPVTVIDEGYAYADVARPGVVPPWPCNEHYDLKAFRWWVAEGREQYGEALLWNIG